MCTVHAIDAVQAMATMLSCHSPLERTTKDCHTTIIRPVMQVAGAHAGALCALSMPLRLCRP